MKYKILIIRSGVGNFTWHLLSAGHNNSFRKIAEAPSMHASKWVVEKTVKPIAKALKCDIDFLDLEQDYEE